MYNAIVQKFQPICLTVDRIGPFQDNVRSFDFTDKQDMPCNLFLIVADNGSGKTTLLDLMTAMLSMLGKEELESYGFEHLDEGEGRAQLDILVTISDDPDRRTNGTHILSIIAGTIGHNVQLKEWTQDMLELYGAESNKVFGFRKADGYFLKVHYGKNYGDAFNRMTREAVGERLLEFNGDSLTYPTLLSFSSYRDIDKTKELDRSISQPSDWGYAPVHRFGEDGHNWSSSLDNLLVWLKWLDDGRFEQAIELVNKFVFKGTNKYLAGIKKDPPEAVLKNEDSSHRLDQLSSGEKSLVQLCLRIGSHMTQNTIILIDEMDVHLHTKWQHRIINWLKDLAKSHPGLTIISTTHSREIINAFSWETEEKDLRKGGLLLNSERDG